MLGRLRKLLGKMLAQSQTVDLCCIEKVLKRFKQAGEGGRTAVWLNGLSSVPKELGNSNP